MRIVLDMQGLQTGSRLRGIGRYTKSFTEALVKSNVDHEIVLVLNGLFPETIEPVRRMYSECVGRDNIHVFEAHGPVCEKKKENAWRNQVAEFMREAFIKSLRPDVVLLTTFFEGYGDDFIGSIKAFDKETPIALIFYDLIPLIYSDIYLSDSSLRAWYETRAHHCKRSDLFLCISDSTRSEAVQYMGLDDSQAVTISAASDATFHPVSSPEGLHRETKRFDISRPFLMCSGATDWRKNHLRLIEAWSKLPLELRQQHQLILAGGMPMEHRRKFERHAEQCGLTKHELIITGPVSDAELNALYNLCKAYVFPSWHEGFGLPILEAMQCNRAVIGSNTASVPEVIGRNDALFDPFDVTSIARKMQRVISDVEFRESLEQYSAIRVERFSWQASADRAIVAIENLVFRPSCSILQSDKPVERQTIARDLIVEISSLNSNGEDQDLRSVAQAVSANHPSSSERQLLLDVSNFVRFDAGTGVQRLVRSILYELLTRPPDDIQVLPVYADNSEGYRYARCFAAEFLGGTGRNEVDESITYRAGDCFLGLDLLHPDVAAAQSGFYQDMRRQGVVVYFVVYDLLPLQFPQYANAGVPDGHRKWLDVVSQGDGLVCISKAVRDDLEAWLGKHSPNCLSSLQLDWFHPGADFRNSKCSDNLPEDAQTVLAALKSATTFLMVGTLEPRKGYTQTLSAFDILWRKGYEGKLVIVGRRGWKVEGLLKDLAKHPELGKRLFQLEDISDQYLAEVYAVSDCLIATSEGEGFGLPLIEAAQNQLPVIARDIAVFREVAGECAFYFRGRDPATLASSIENWTALYNNGRHPRTNGIQWRTWSDSAQELAQICLNMNQHYNPVCERDNDSQPTLDRVKSQACTYSQIRSACFARWCAELKHPVICHRKLWEWCYILEALEQNGVVGPNKFGLGFGVGVEPLTSLFAARGCRIVASDLPTDDNKHVEWSKSDQHADELARLNEYGLCPSDLFTRLVTFRPVNMTVIPDNLTDFDFVWSSCALEHLGDLATGAEFVVRSMRCLRPGGVAVHTTELNVSSQTETVEKGPTVAYRRSDLESLIDRLRLEGHAVEATFRLGDTAEDHHVDVAPYTDTHLKTELGGFVITSFGLLIRAGKH